MARTKNKHNELKMDVEPASDIDSNLQAMAQHRFNIMSKFGDNATYERERIVYETRFYMAQSAESMLEAGKRLVILKECEPHGTLIDIIENELNIPYRTAARMMQAAIKYLSPAMKSNVSALAQLGKTKLFELVTEDDEELANLVEGGTLAGFTLDDIDRMTSRELRNALRNAHEDINAQRRVLSDKNDKIDELYSQLEKKSRAQSSEENTASNMLRREACNIAYEAEGCIRGRLHAAFSALKVHCASFEEPVPSELMTGLLCQIEQAIHQLRMEFFLDAAPSNHDKPDWLIIQEPKISRPDWMSTPESTEE
ncbi:DUF3102 domain-containing protein [Hafnia alvei]|uniref:DUF3102 domain-containing protein n=1 Tax=Hafnia alvei TaxID=569 RepID=UPI000DFA747A|nr:DUF3102 domain-containing protein [Hafnia alvei]STQ73693.1 Uncharacterised protein [Hafnia alvei]